MLTIDFFCKKRRDSHYYLQGRVVAFSPHPERTAGLEDFVRRAARWSAHLK